MPTCISCNKDMGHDPNECDECGEAIHRKCHKLGCPSCAEIAERAVARTRHTSLAGKKPAKETPPTPSQREVEPSTPKPSKRVAKPAKPEVEDIPPLLDAKPVFKGGFREPKRGDAVVYQTGEWYVMKGSDCPKGGRKQTVRAAFAYEVETGYRGFGMTEKEALAELEHYAFGKG